MNTVRVGGQVFFSFFLGGGGVTDPPKFFPGDLPHQLKEPHFDAVAHAVNKLDPILPLRLRLSYLTFFGNFLSSSWFPRRLDENMSREILQSIFSETKVYIDHEASL